MTLGVAENCHTNDTWSGGHRITELEMGRKGGDPEFQIRGVRKYLWSDGLAVVSCEYASCSPLFALPGSDSFTTHTYRSDSG